MPQTRLCESAGSSSAGFRRIPHRRSRARPPPGRSSRGPTASSSRRSRPPSIGVDCIAEIEGTPDDLPLLARIETVRAAWAARPPDPDADLDAPRPADVAAALLAWAVPFPTLDTFRGAIAARRAAIAELCRDDARLTFATAHATKGLEFDDVAVLGMERNRFPSARSLADAPDPGRALEEERRLAYVAWTRARRSLTLVYDPSAPSSFLLEAFSAEELGLDPGLSGD